MTTDSRDERRRRISVSALVFGVATPVTYAAERAVEWARGETGDPRMILRSLHTAYYWRAGIALWFGGVAAILVYAWLSRGRDPSPAARTLAIAACILVPLMLLSSWRFP